MPGRPAGQAGAEPHRAAGRRVAEGVVQEIAQHLLQAVEVPQDGRHVPALHLKADARLLRTQREDLGAVGEELAHRYGGSLHALLPGLDAGEVQQLLDQMQEPPGLVFDDAGSPFFALGLRDGAVAQGLREAPDRREGCLQLMGDVGKEVAQRLLRAADRLRHAVEVLGQGAGFGWPLHRHLLLVVAAGYADGGPGHPLQGKIDGTGEDEPHDDGGPEPGQAGQQQPRRQVADDGAGAVLGQGQDQGGCAQRPCGEPGRQGHSHEEKVTAVLGAVGTLVQVPEVLGELAWRQVEGLV